MFSDPNKQQLLPINTFPKWKYFMIVFVLLVGFFYAAPNIFGEDPAVQISGLADNTISTEQVAQLEQSWADNGLTPIAVDSEKSKQLVARFSSNEEQAQAHKVASDFLTPDKSDLKYVVAQNFAPATPDWLKNAGGKPMKLGLDLRGGIYFLMQVDMEQAIEKQKEQLRSDFVTTLTDEKPVIRGRIQKTENGLNLTVKPSDISRAHSALYQKYIDRIDLNIVTVGGREVIQATFNPARLRQIQDSAVDQNRLILSTRVNSLGVAEPLIQRQGVDRIVVQLPGMQDSALAKQVLGATATLEFRLVNEDANVDAAVRGNVPAGSKLFPSEYGPTLVYDDVRVSGDHLIDAFPGFDPDTKRPIVHVKLDGVGGAKMLETTVKFRGKNRLAMILKDSVPKFKEVDGKQVFDKSTIKERLISAPSINGEFGTDFQISGNFTEAETKDLALNLRSGALVAPTFFIRERTIGPSLGQDNIDKGFNSVVIGFVLVLIFMLVYYRLFGLVANVALTLNLVLIVSLLSIMGATLTLPGIAGIVLTVGMAVDANVLIFERIREELRSGTKAAQAIDKGYGQALSTIADANITTMIAAIVLFAIGTGPVKGFAITLFFGILTSMFTAIVVSRAIVNLMYGGKTVKKLSI